MTAAGIQAGRELDVLVAEAVMGLVPCQAPQHADGSLLPCHAKPDSTMHGGETPTYSTDIAAAWLVVERMREHGWMSNVCSSGVPTRPTDLGPVVAQFWRLAREPNPDREIAEHGEAAFAETASLAICRAALAVAEAFGLSPTA